MEKKTIFWTLAISAVIVVGFLIYMHYVPIWVSLTNVVTLAAGVALGWIAHVLYNKYIKE